MVELKQLSAEAIPAAPKRARYHHKETIDRRSILVFSKVRGRCEEYRPPL